MNQEENENSCKPRFKRIENFLRRAAFNLGNSPSQTEVKIISCIPVDVTDLQQKILCLEKELYVARKKIATKNKIDDNIPAVVGRVVHCSSIVNKPNSELQCSITSYDDNSQNFYTRNSDCCLEQNKSNISFEYPFNSKPDAEKMYERYPSTESVISKWDRHKRIANERVKNLFRKRKKKKNTQEKSRGKTQMVYYAHTDTHNVDVFSHSYLTNLFRKHHDPKLVVEEFSDTSHYSKPICRDVKHHSTNLSPGSDICSCCHGRFHNLDVYMNDFNTTCNPIMHTYNKTKLNMSKMVDLIPVKEESDKAKSKLKNEDIKIKPKMVNNVQPFNKNVHTKHRHNNPEEFYEKDVLANKPKKNNKINRTPRNVTCNHNAIIKSNEQPEVDSSKSCSIDCGNAYVKPSTVPVAIHTEPKLPVVKIKNIANKNKLKLAENVHSDKLKTAIYDCTKTEAALNEIKGILQSVLAEVKNNALECLLKEEKIQKDAIVQKESSQNNIQQLTFPSYFTYNTSNCNNPYLVPYPGQIPVAQYCLPNMAYNFANYPVSPVSPRTCTCHEKNELQFTEKAVTTTSTNTDNIQHDTNSKETEKLIKEIYKSVALNMEYPSKENSTECDEFKSMFDGSISTDYKTYDSTANVSKVMKKDVQVEALLSTTTTNTTASNIVYTATSCKSGYRSKFLNCDSSNTDNKENRMFREYMKNNYIAEEGEFLDTVTSIETEDNDIKPKTENIKERKKNTLIKDIFKSVFTKKKEIIKNEETSSDSDDYETIYSEKAIKAINTPQAQRRRAGINYVRPPAKQNKRTPYMDQEYRRQWNEDLIFQKKKHYTAKARKTLPKDRRGPNEVYYRDYEARAALVQPRHLMNYKLTRDASDVYKTSGAKFNASKKMSWLKNHKIGIGCGKSWKKFILNN